MLGLDEERTIGQVVCIHTYRNELFVWTGLAWRYLNTSAYFSTEQLLEAAGRIEVIGTIDLQKGSPSC